MYVPQDSYHQCVRRASDVRRPRLYHASLVRHTIINELNLLKSTYQCQTARLLLVDTRPKSSELDYAERKIQYVKLTGSTANFVTASSPDSFRQTFPSGTLKFGEQMK